MAKRKRCLGVDLGSQSIKVAEVVMDRDAVRIHRLVQSTIEVEPGATPAQRQEATAKALRALLRSNRIKTREAVFALPGQVAFVRRFRLPATTPERLERIIRYEARQQIPFPLERTHLEFQSHPLPESGEVEVILVAVRRDHIQDFMSMVDRTGLSPLAVAIGPFALYNFFASQIKPPEGLAAGDKKGGNGSKPGASKKKFSLNVSLGKKLKKGAKPESEENTEAEKPAGESVPVMEEVKAFVHVGAAVVELAIARQGKLISLGFTRTVPTAGNELTRSIQEKCHLPSFEEAEKVKRNNARLMTFDVDPETMGEDYNAVACQAATSMTDRLVADLRRSLDFYISQPDGMAVDSIVVSGGQATMEGFPAYIEEKLGLSVSRLEDLACKWMIVAPTAAESGEKPNLTAYPIALGLAFQGLGIAAIDIDFLPREKKVLRDFPYRRAGVMLGILAGIVVFASQAGGHYMTLYQQQRASIEDVFLSRKQQDEEAAKADTSRKEVANYFDNLAPALGTRTFWLKFLALVQEVKPAEALIDTIVMDEDGSVLLVGIAERENTAADFQSRLKDAVKEPVKEPRLEDVFKTSYVGFDQQVYKFIIRLQIKDKDRKNRMTLANPKPEDQQGGRGSAQRRPNAGPESGPVPGVAPPGGRVNPYQASFK